MADLRPWEARLQRLATPTLAPGGRTTSSFHVCGLIGWAAGIGLAALLTRWSGLDLRVTGVLAMAAIVTFAGLTMLIKILVGEEILVYYHHEIAVVAVSWLLLRGLGQPVLPYLDVVFMGLGLFLACGRVGCLMVGCCHGQPHAWGIAYRPAHAEAGFPPHLVGVRLFPIQLVEALFVVATVCIGTIMILNGRAPGSAVAFYSIAYGLGRFALELLRGDIARPYWHGASEAQWTSFAILLAVLALSGLGPVPFAGPLLAAILVMATALGLSAATDGPVRGLLRPRHVGEIAALLAAAHARAQATGELHIGRTSLGLRISASTVADGRARFHVFAFSDEAHALDDVMARRLALLISYLRRTIVSGELQKGERGVYHLIVPAAATPTSKIAHAV